MVARDTFLGLLPSIVQNHLSPRIMDCYLTSLQFLTLFHNICAPWLLNNTLKMEILIHIKQVEIVKVAEFCTKLSMFTLGQACAKV